MAIMEVKKLVKNYFNGHFETKVLHGVDMKIEVGEFVSIMGPSGSGKSTLLYQLSLIDDPTSGEIFLDGKEITSLMASEKQLIRLNDFGFVFQDYALVPELSAIENVMVPMIMMGFSKQRAYDTSRKYLERIGLQDKLRNLPSQLSGGQQQRVSIVRGVAHTPKVLFADEPTASLDTEMSNQVMELLLELHSQGQTIVMVTHEPEYGALTQRIINMKDGRIDEQSLGVQRAKKGVASK